MSESTMTSFGHRYGPWALVTGVSSGIGRAIANELAARGLNLVGVGRDPSALAEWQADPVPAGRRKLAVAVDLARPESLGVIRDATSGIDVGLVVPAAGFGSAGAFHESDPVAATEMLAVNCRSTLELAREYLPAMVARRHGGWIFLSSIVAFQGMPYSANYAATKAYVQSLAESLAVELTPFGVDVVAAAPGPTKTKFADRAGMVMGKAADAEAVAKSIVATLGRGSTVVPGGLAKLLRYSMTGLPRWAKVRIMGRVMKGMLAPVNARN